jgi:hypothetical protein
MLARRLVSSLVQALVAIVGAPIMALVEYHDRLELDGAEKIKNEVWFAHENLAATGHPLASALSECANKFGPAYISAKMADRCTRFCRSLGKLSNDILLIEHEAVAVAKAEAEALLKAYQAFCDVFGPSSTYTLILR